MTEDIKKLQNSLYNFLSTNNMKFLVIESDESHKQPKLASINVRNLLRHFAENYEKEQVLSRYLIEENQLHLEWSHFVNIVISSDSGWKLKPLVILECPEITELIADDREVLNKITKHFNLGAVEKLIFVSSRTGLFNEYLQTFESGEFLKIDKFGNNLSSVLYFNDNECLIESMVQGHLYHVEELIHSGINVNQPTDQYKQTALHIAAEKGYINLVVLLLKCGARMLCNKDGDSPLHSAARYGHKEIVSTLFKNEDVVNVKNIKGETALHVAALNGHQDVCLFLLQINANINIQDLKGQTALHMAAASGYKEVILSLLNNTANVNIQNEGGCTALHEAACEGHKDVVLALLNSNADINIQDKGGWTALHEAAFEGHKNIVLVLLKNNANVNIQDEQEGTALHQAALEGHKSIVLALLQNGANVNLQNDEGETALHGAAYEGHKDVILALLKNNVNVNIQDEYGQTALNRAASMGYEDVVVVLLHSNADVNIQDNIGWTALHEAAYHGHRDVAVALLKNGADVSIKTSNNTNNVQIAMESWEGNVPKLAHEVHYDMSYQKDTALHFAASEGHYDVVSTLLEYGANVNITNDNECTPLQIAIVKNHNNIVKILLKHLDDVNEHDFYGSTVLHEATYKNNKEVIKALLDCEAEINVKNGNNDTPLHLAAFNGYADIFELLLSRGADATIKNKQNLTPYELIEKTNGLSPEHIKSRREDHTTCCILPLNDVPNSFIYVDPDFKLSILSDPYFLENISRRRRTICEDSTKPPKEKGSLSYYISK